MNEGELQNSWVRVALAAALWTVLLAATHIAKAQVAGEEKLWGVVWDAPGSAATATSDLLRMADVGVQAVRTTGPLPTELLTLADSLDIRVFQELELRFLPARRLLQQQTEIERSLAALVEGSLGHPVAVDFGLGVDLDTSDPRTCGVLERLSSIVRRRIPVARTYYVTAFIEDDRCGDAVDYRLLDRHLTEDVVESREYVGLGLAALGKGRDPASAPGLVNPRSAESEARFMEEALTALGSASASDVPAVFVYRWRDAAPRRVPSFSFDRFGLLDSLGRASPAFDVVVGFYSGEQDAFAFPLGSGGDRHRSWLVLVVWAAIAAIAATYAGSPTLRIVVQRYFLSHGFYREAVAEGRDVLPAANLVLLAAAATCFGVVVTVCATVAARTPIADAVAHWTPDSIRRMIALLVAEPWLLVVFVASAHAFASALWTSALSIGSRAGKPALPAQTFMLAVWSQWPIVLLGMGAAAVASLDGETQRAWVVVLAGALAAALVWAAVRTVLDYKAVTRVPWYVWGLLALVSPAGLVVLLRLGTTFSHAPELTLLRHLVFRS